MFFNFLEKLLPTILAVILYFLAHLFDSPALNSLYFVDFLYRVNLSDTLVNWFNFYWTSNLYLSLVFFTLLGLVALLFNQVPNYLFLIMFSGWCFWGFENVAFVSYNLNNTLLDITNSEVNSLLTNTLNKYHPLILYTSAFNLVLLVFYTTNWIQKNPLFLLANQSKFFYQNLLWTLYLIFIALATGSWWALQEGTWGGWWNWDASEVLGLLIFLITLVELHFNHTYFSFLKKNERSLISILLLWISYFFIQLNFELTSHSFGTRFNYFFNNHFFFIQMIMSLLTVTGWWVQCTYIRRIQVYSLSTISSIKPLFLLLPTTLLLYLGLVVLIIIILSFTPLLNYFLWQFFKLNSFNTLISIEFFTSLFTFTIWLTFYQSMRLSSTLNLLPLITTNINPIYFLSQPFFKRVSIFQLTHIFLLLFLTVNSTLCYTQLAYNWSGLYPGTLAMTGGFMTHTSSSYSCHNFFLYLHNCYVADYYLKWTTFNFLYKGNSLTLNPFFLVTNTESVFTCFFTGDFLTKSSLILELTSFIGLTDLFLFFTLILFTQVILRTKFTTCNL